MLHSELKTDFIKFLKFQKKMLIHLRTKMSKRPPGSFFRNRNQKIEAEKIQLAKQWEKTRKNWLKCENVDKSEDSLDVDVNEVNIEQHENENTIIKEPLPLIS